MPAPAQTMLAPPGGAPSVGPPGLLDERYSPKYLLAKKRRPRLQRGYQQAKRLEEAARRPAGPTGQVASPLEAKQVDMGSVLGGIQSFTQQTAAASSAMLQNLIADAQADKVAASRGVSGGAQPEKGIGRFIAAARTQLGVPYDWGGTDPKGGGSAGFDCSGLTQWAARKIGVKLPHSSVAQWNMLRSSWVSRKQLQPGDLMFFDYGTRNGAGPEHVGIYLGGNRILHAYSKSRPVEITNVDWSAFMNGARLKVKRGK
jgi:cell wall-associated NlpC family hydrolase